MPHPDQLFVEQGQIKGVKLVKAIVVFDLIHCITFLFTFRTFNTLTQSQETFIKELVEKCHLLLKETYPQGTHFAESVRVRITTITFV
jgi:hypothetical protein